MPDTLVDLATRACYLARRKPTKTYDMDRAKEAVNEVYQRVLDSGEFWDFLEFEGNFSVEAGADVYRGPDIAAAIGLPEGAHIREIKTMVPDTSGGRPLGSMSWTALERFFYSTQDNEPPGTPLSFATWGEGDSYRVRFGPTPDANYTFGVMIRADVDPLDDTDTPLIPPGHRRPILTYGAAAVLLRQEGGVEALREAQDREAHALDAVARMERAHGNVKISQISLVDPTMNDDLPGSLSYEWGYWD